MLKIKERALGIDQILTTKRMAKLSSSEVELDDMAEVGYYGIGPLSVKSSDKVLLNPYTQLKVLSMVLSIVYVVYLHHG